MWDNAEGYRRFIALMNKALYRYHQKQQPEQTPSKSGHGEAPAHGVRIAPRPAIVLPAWTAARFHVAGNCRTPRQENTHFPLIRLPRMVACRGDASTTSPFRRQGPMK